MKRFCVLMALLALLCSLLAGCGSLQTTAHGLENAAYLQIVGNTSAYSTVTVVLDGDVAFDVKVNSSKQRSVKNEYTYKIAVGAHDIEVRKGSDTIIKKKIFTSANEIKIVELP